MLIKRSKVLSYLDLFNKFKNNNNFNITTKYKILKLKEYFLKESEYDKTLLLELGNNYGEIEEDGTIKINKENQEKVQNELNNYYNQDIQVPDLYFTLDELQDVDWDSLELLMPFIKE